MTVSGGDGPRPSAAAALLDHEPALRAAARALCRDQAACDDLIQDTFERAIRYLGEGQEPVRATRAWLVTILRNRFVDRLRAERPAGECVEDYPAPDVEPQPPWLDVTLAEVSAACAVIPKDLREVFELHYLQGLRYKQIAARLDIPENTVASRLFRARMALREQLLGPAGRGDGG